jgi:Peptidase family M41
MSQPSSQPNQPDQSTTRPRRSRPERRPTAVAGRRGSRAAGDGPLATAGMSEEIGAVSALPRSGEKSYGAGAASQHTLELIDEEVRRILTECAEQAQRTLAEHREQFSHLAQALLERETLDEADARWRSEPARPAPS